jgi:uncharacterized membrane protein
MSSPIASDDEGLLRELLRESWDAFVAMPRWAQWLLVGGAVLHLAASLPVLPPHLIPPVWLASTRVAFVAMVVGTIENAKKYDEFYARVYLDACAITLVVSTVILYAAWNYGIDFGLRTVSLILGIFVLGFVAAFARLRRHA